jgi:hypothetical protein
MEKIKWHRCGDAIKKEKKRLRMFFLRIAGTDEFLQSLNTHHKHILGIA